MGHVVVGSDTTKTSGRWSRRPGNFDLLNLKALFPGTRSGVPLVARDDFEPAALEPYNYTREMERARTPGAAVHFFLDDYRFEAAWTTPERALARVAAYGLALAPDFSVYPWMPRVMAEWQVYRARWVAAYWQWRGVRVIPSATWSTPDTYELCWQGVALGSAIAVSAVGVGREPLTGPTHGKGPIPEKGPTHGGGTVPRPLAGPTPEKGDAAVGPTPAELFRLGLQSTVDALQPARLIVYGGLGSLADGLDLPPRREYPTLQERRGWRHRARAS